MTVEVWEVRTGDVIDTVRLNDAGLIEFDTEAGRGIFERLHRRHPDLDATALLELAGSWSNGYLATRAVGSGD